MLKRMIKAEINSFAIFILIWVCLTVLGAIFFLWTYFTIFILLLLEVEYTTQWFKIYVELFGTILLYSIFIGLSIHVIISFILQILHYLVDKTSIRNLVVFGER